MKLFNRVALWGIVLSLLVSTNVFCSTKATTDSQNRPNIVFVISDDHRWDCVGVSGNPHVKTPNLDQMAKDGLYFPNATVVTPQCSPCRASLLTGLPPHQNGWYSNQTQQRTVHDRNGFKDIPTLPGQLRESGYHTVLVGKWHLTPDPWNCGFSEVRRWLPQGAGKYRDLSMAYGNSRETSPTHGFAQEVFGKDAVDFIRGQSNSEKPFFLWLAMTAPHTPLKPNPPAAEALYADKKDKDIAPPGFTVGSADELLTSFSVRGKPVKLPKKGQPTWTDYYAAISSVDTEIGRIRQALQLAGKVDNTIIVFMGDNGMMRNSRGWSGKVLPYDESIRVPLIVYAPGRIKEPGTSKAMVSSLDLPATFLKWAGRTLPAKWIGRDLSPLLKTRRAPGFEEAFCEFADNVSKKFGPVEYRLITTGDSKLITWRDPAKSTEFYDLKNDPRELDNLAETSSYADQMKSLQQKLDLWKSLTDDKGMVGTEDLVVGEGED